MARFNKQKKTKTYVFLSLNLTEVPFARTLDCWYGYDTSGKPQISIRIQQGRSESFGNKNK